MIGVKLSNKGFSLVEMLAVVVILGIVATIMVPTVTGVLNSNKEKGYESLKQSIISSAKVYMSNNRYDIALADGSCPKNIENQTANIVKIGNNSITDSKIPLSLIAKEGDLDDEIVDPRDRETTLDLENSYIIITFNCDTKQYKYNLEDSALKWS